MKRLSLTLPSMALLALIALGLIGFASSGCRTVDGGEAVNPYATLYVTFDS